MKGIITLHGADLNTEFHVAIGSIIYYCRYESDDYTTLMLQEEIKRYVKETPYEIDSLIARNINPFAFAYDQSVIDQILNKPTSVPLKPLSGLSPSITVTDELHNEPVEIKAPRVKCRDCRYLFAERRPGGKAYCTLYNDMPIKYPDAEAPCDGFKEIKKDDKKE